MTRSKKANDPVRDGSAPAGVDAMPRNFGKHATHGEKTKKSGGGKANWGRDGDELVDTDEFSMHKARRRSNSMGHIENQFVKSKFEMSDEPVFTEEHANAVEAAAHADEVNSTSSLESEATAKS